jgi:hypothetical protein
LCARRSLFLVAASAGAAKFPLSSAPVAFWDAADFLKQATNFVWLKQQGVVFLKILYNLKAGLPNIIAPRLNQFNPIFLLKILITRYIQGNSCSPKSNFIKILRGSHYLLLIALPFNQCRISTILMLGYCYWGRDCTTNSNE